VVVSQTGRRSVFRNAAAAKANIPRERGLLTGGGIVQNEAALLEILLWAFGEIKEA
jgi:hypothetical protein